MPRGIFGLDGLELKGLLPSERVYISVQERISYGNRQLRRFDVPEMGIHSEDSEAGDRHLTGMSKPRCKIRVSQCVVMHGKGFGAPVIRNAVGVKISDWNIAFVAN